MGVAERCRLPLSWPLVHLPFELLKQTKLDFPDKVQHSDTKNKTKTRKTPPWAGAPFCFALLLVSNRHRVPEIKTKE
jgi:hypothetical protein